MKFSQELFNKAIDFAANAHKAQMFPGKEYNYVVHLTQVTFETINILLNEPMDNPDLPIQCALLHDCIEDTAVTYENVLANFGKEVADGVLALTKNENLPKEERMRDSLERLLKQPKQVQLVKLADRITNLQAPPHYWSKEKILNYAEEAKVIHRYLKDANSYGAKRLLGKIAEYAKYA